MVGLVCIWPQESVGAVSFPSDCKEVCSRLGLLRVDLFRLSPDWYSEMGSFRSPGNMEARDGGSVAESYLVWDRAQRDRNCSGKNLCCSKVMFRHCPRKYSVDHMVYPPALPTRR